jgi:outer membrane protein assembly factor BamB
LDLDRGELVVTGQSTGVHGLDPADGTVRWRFPVRGAGTVVRGPGPLLLLSSSVEGAMAIEPGGRLRWRQQVDAGVLSPPLLVGDTAVLTHSDVGLLAFDARTGEPLVQLDTGSGMSGLPTWDPGAERVYAVSNRGMLVALTTTTAL